MITLQLETAQEFHNVLTPFVSMSFTRNRRTHHTDGCVCYLEKYMSMRQDAPDQQALFYGSVAWKNCRKEYRKSVGGLCERCRAKGLIEPGYIVHHKQYVDAQNIQDPSVLLNPDNLELLCMDCHNKEHGKDKRRKRRYIVREDGKIIC